MKETRSIIEKDGFRETTTREPIYPRKHLVSPNYDSPAGEYELKRFAQWTREELIAHVMHYWRTSESQGARLREIEPRLQTVERDAKRLDAENTELAVKVESLDQLTRQRFGEIRDVEEKVRERDAAIVKLALMLTKEIS